MCKHTYCAGLSLYEAQCSAGSYSMIYYYYVNLWLNVFFSLLGTLMRGCIDGSSGKRHFSDGLTNSNVNAYLKWEMSSKSSNASRISAYLHPFICLFLSMSVLSNIWNTFVSHLLSIMQLKSLFPVGHWTCQLNNLKKNMPFSCCLPTFFITMDKDAAFACRLSHDYEVACCWWTVPLLWRCPCTLEKCLLV